MSGSISNLISININSNTNNILSGTTDNFVYQVSFPADKWKEINAVSVSSITLPKSFYQINENNNTFILTEFTTNTTVTIPAGNYNISQFFNTVGGLLTAASTHFITYTLSFNTTSYDTGILKITQSPAYPASLYFGNTSLSSVFGFPRDSTNIFNGSGVLLGSQVINLNESNTVYLNSSMVSSFFNDATSNSSNTLCVVYTGSYVNYSYITQYFDIITNMKPFFSKNSQFSFSLVDQDNTPVNLHGVDFSFTLNIFTYTPNEGFYKKINKFINYYLTNNNDDDNDVD